jgi:hypothetical protein
MGLTQEGGAVPGVVGVIDRLSVRPPTTDHWPLFK